MTDSPLSRPLTVAKLPPEGLDVEVVADAAERAALAELNGTPSIERLVARLRVRPFGHEGVEVTGRLEAQATRTCVVTLEPFPETVDEEIDVRFVPASDLPPAEPGEEIEIGPNDPPDPYVDGVVDLGAVVSEFLTLGLDPHPRKPGATFDAPADGDDEPSPFAALLKLKKADRGD